MEQEQNPSQRDALVENLKQQRAQFSNQAQIGRAVYENQAQQVIEAADAYWDREEHEARDEGAIR